MAANYTCDSCGKNLNEQKTPHLSVRGSVCSVWFDDGRRAYEFLTEYTPGMSPTVTFCNARCFERWVKAREKALSTAQDTDPTD